MSSVAPLSIRARPNPTAPSLRTIIYCTPRPLDQITIAPLLLDAPSTNKSFGVTSLYKLLKRYEHRIKRIEPAIQFSIAFPSKRNFQSSRTKLQIFHNRLLEIACHFDKKSNYKLNLSAPNTGTNKSFGMTSLCKILKRYDYYFRRIEPAMQYPTTFPAK